MKLINLNSQESVKNLYLNVYKITDEILREKLDYFSQSESMVDIYAIAEKYNIKIVEKKLELSPNIFQQEVISYLDSYNGKTIYVEETESDFTKRYGVAHEIGHYLLHEEDEGIFSYYCVDPLFSKNSEEYICDIFASFLLMPVETVIDTMQKYISENKNQKITVYSWLEYLAKKMGVSDYYTTICFQNIKYLCTFLMEESYQIKNNANEEIYDKIRSIEFLFK